MSRSSPTPPDTPALPSPAAARADDRRPWLLALVGLVVMHLCHPLCWPGGDPDLWLAVVPAGVAIALAAWLGPRAVLVVAVQALLAAVQSRLLPPARPWYGLPAGPGGAILEVLFPSLEVLGGWWFFDRVLPRTTATRLTPAQAFGDPRCASLFLVLVPGFLVGGLALAWVGLGWLLGPAEGASFWRSFGSCWLGRALGVAAVTPPLVILLTPWLARNGFTASDGVRQEQPQPGAPPSPLATQEPRRPGAGDWVEIAGLTLATGLFETLLVIAYDRGEQLAAWQVWGVPLLLVIWACFRQGTAGGTLVAAGSALFPLALAGLGQTRMPSFLLEGHLLAQCTTALLVSSAAAWIRASESSYRRIVGHVPVVIYSTRAALRPPGGDRERPESPAEPEAVVMLRGLFSWLEVSFVSPATWDVFGCAPGELLGDYAAWLRRVDPADREILLAALAQLGRQRKPVTCEYRLASGEARGAGGENKGPASLASQRPSPAPNARWVRDTLAPHFGPDGRLDGWDGVLTDITEQRVLADDLRRTSSMFHALVANLPAGVFFVQGSGGRPILVNARARQLLGRREDTGAGLDHLAAVYHLHKPNGAPYPVEDLPVWQALRKSLTTMRDDIVVHRPDGRKVPLVTWAAPIDLVGRGQPDAAVWVIEDLTTLRQAEAALRESESRLRAVIETMAEGLVVQDASGTIVECNPAACAILGLPAEQIRGRSSLDPEWRCVREDGGPLPGDEHPAMVSLRTGRPVRDVVMGVPRRRGPDSEEKEIGWILVNSLPLPPGPGPVRTTSPRVVTTFADITAHLRTLEGLRASEERYRGLVETLPLALLQLDPHLRPVYANPATRELTGFDAQELAARRQDETTAAWLSLFCEQDRPAVEDLLRRALQGGTGRAESRYRTRGGEERVGFLLAQPRGAGGATLLLMDVTRERRLEADLRRSQRMELIGRLASGIAHDFNNVLTAILALVHMARERVAADHPVQADLKAIDDAGEQACRLAAQLLSFGKARRPAGPLRAVGDVNRVARQTLELLRSTLPSTIAIEASLAGEDLPVPVDDTQLQQVIMNLCLNARDAMPRGGRLAVRTACEQEGGRSWARLSVQDTGRGVPEEVRGNIFDPFFTTKENGAGLGLAVVQQIAEGHGGRVGVSTAEGQGSRFDVWLPLETTPA